MLLKGEKGKSSFVKAKTYFGRKMGFLETLGHLKKPRSSPFGPVHRALQVLPTQQYCPCQSVCTVHLIITMHIYGLHLIIVIVMYMC